MICLYVEEGKINELHPDNVKETEYNIRSVPESASGMSDVYLLNLLEGNI